MRLHFLPTDHSAKPKVCSTFNRRTFLHPVRFLPSNHPPRMVFMFTRSRIIFCTTVRKIPLAQHSLFVLVLNPRCNTEDPFEFSSSFTAMDTTNHINAVPFMLPELSCLQHTNYFFSWDSSPSLSNKRKRDMPIHSLRAQKFIPYNIVSSACIPSVLLSKFTL